MTDGIIKGVGEQLGELAKDVASEIVSVPAKLTGMDAGSHETSGAGSGGKKQGSGAHTQSKQPSEPIVDPLSILRQKDEVNKQQGLARARELLKQFNAPAKSAEQSIAEEQKLEEMEKQKQEIETEKKKAQNFLGQPSTKPKRGNLFGQKMVKKQKQFGSEQSKNAVHQ